MPKKIFTPFEGTVDADDLNGWEKVRVDILGESANPNAARIYLGAAPIIHAHNNATASTNGVGGASGFIDPQSLERFHRATSFPASVQTQVPTGAVFMLMRQDGTVQGISLSSLVDIFGSGGPTPSGGGPRIGGESGGTINSVRIGGESGGTVGTTRIGGESGGTINM